MIDEETDEYIHNRLYKIEHVLQERIDEYNKSRVSKRYYLESILYNYNGIPATKFFSVPKESGAWTPAYAKLNDDDTFEVYNNLTDDRLFSSGASDDCECTFVHTGICMFDSNTLCDFLSKLDKTPTDAEPIAYNLWQIKMPDEEVPRMYKIVDIQASEVVLLKFLQDKTLVCEWPFKVDPREYLKDKVYDNLVETAARDTYYDALYERAPLDSDYKSVLVERLVRYGIIPATKLDLDDAGKLVYKPIDGDDCADQLTADEMQGLLHALADYYVAEYGGAKQFILSRFTKKPQLVDGELKREFDMDGFTNFLYYNDVDFTEEYFKTNHLITDIVISIIGGECAKIDKPIKINDRFVAFRQA